MIRHGSYACPFGNLVIGWSAEAVASIRLAEFPPEQSETSPLSDDAAKQLLEYLAGSRQHFDFPIRPEGTAFQKTVWNALREIPYGQVRTYGQIAAAIGKPNAARAVGMACNRNPLWIVIPCHRVVGSGGTLTGYAGGLPTKAALLELEQAHK